MRYTALLIVFACLMVTGPASAKKCPMGHSRKMMQRVPLGTTVPDIELDAYHDSKIIKVRTGSFKGKWLVLFFYPGDFTFVCPTELKELAANHDAFKKAGAEIISVSTDSVYVHRAWHKHDKSISMIKYPMASDRTGALSKSLGAHDPRTGQSLRASFIIDPDGKIIACEYHDDSIGRNAEELLRKLLAAKAVRESEGDFWPGGWKPGAKLINPDK